MTDAIRSWSWSGCGGNPAIVEVYTTAARWNFSSTAKRWASGAAAKTARWCSG